MGGGGAAPGGNLPVVFYKDTLFPGQKIVVYKDTLMPPGTWPRAFSVRCPGNIPPGMCYFRGAIFVLDACGAWHFRGLWRPCGMNARGHRTCPRRARATPAPLFQFLVCTPAHATPAPVSCAPRIMNNKQCLVSKSNHIPFVGILRFLPEHYLSKSTSGPFEDNEAFIPGYTVHTEGNETECVKGGWRVCFNIPFR